MLIKLFFRIRNCINSNFPCKLFKPFLYFIYRLIMWLYGSSISLNTKFEVIPIFPHGLYGIFISGGAKIGKNVTIYQHVTIGFVNTIGSKHIGSPTIGDNVVIGANAVVIDDVPDNCIVAGIPAKIIKQGIRIEDYV